MFSNIIFPYFRRAHLWRLESLLLHLSDCFSDLQPFPLQLPHHHPERLSFMPRAAFKALGGYHLDDVQVQ